MKILKFVEKEKKPDSFKPPANVAKQAKRALDYRDKHGRDKVKGGTRVGWERANQLVNRENLSWDTIKRMFSFFSRHKGNEKVSPEYKDEPYKDKGYIAWLLWGGDSGKTWVEKIYNKYKEE